MNKSVDLRYLSSITSNNKEEMSAFIEEVLYVKKEVVSSMISALENNQLSAIKDLAHKLKSVAKIFGSDSIVQILSYMESVPPKEENEKTIHALFEILYKELERWEDVLCQNMVQLGTLVPS